MRQLTRDKILSKCGDYYASVSHWNEEPLYAAYTVYKAKNGERVGSVFGNISGFVLKTWEEVGHSCFMRFGIKLDIADVHINKTIGSRVSNW